MSFYLHWSLITGRRGYKTEVGGAREVLPLNGGGKALAMLKGGRGTKRFRVFFMQQLEVLAILKGVRKNDSIL